MNVGIVHLNKNEKESQKIYDFIFPWLVENNIDSLRIKFELSNPKYSFEDNMLLSVKIPYLNGMFVESESDQFFFKVKKTVLENIQKDFRIFINRNKEYLIGNLFEEYLSKKFVSLFKIDILINQNSLILYSVSEVGFNLCSEIDSSGMSILGGQTKGFSVESLFRQVKMGLLSSNEKELINFQLLSLKDFEKESSSYNMIIQYC